MGSPPRPEYETVGRVDGETMSFTADGLKEGQKYYIRVKAENPAGLSESGAELKKPAVAKLPFGEFRVPCGWKKRFLHQQHEQQECCFSKHSMSTIIADTLFFTVNKLFQDL